MVSFTPQMLLGCFVAPLAAERLQGNGGSRLMAGRFNDNK